MTNPATDAYAAGLFDGEGCVGAGQTRGAWTISCATGMTIRAKPVLTRLAAEYGGKVRLHRAATDKWAEAWTWSLHGTEAASFLRRVLPHLVIKREVAETALRMESVRLSLEQTSTGRFRWTPEASERCSTLHRRIKELNRRGPAPQASPPRRGRLVAHLVAGTWVRPQSDLLSDLGWEPFSETWPAWGMTRGGAAYELPTPELPTVEQESSSSPLVPTPLHSDGGGPRGSSAGWGLRDFSRTLLPTPLTADANNGGCRANPGGNPTLTGAVEGFRPSDMARHGWAGPTPLLPTPTASDTNGSGEHGTGGPDLRTAVSLLPTPRATDGEKGGPNQRGSSGDLMLPSAVQAFLPTPQARDWKDIGAPSEYGRKSPPITALLGTPRAQHGEDRNSNIYPRDLSQPQNLENQLARLPGAPTPPPSPDGSASSDDQLPGQLSLDDAASD